MGSTDPRPYDRDKSTLVKSDRLGTNGVDILPVFPMCSDRKPHSYATLVPPSTASTTDVMDGTGDIAGTTGGGPSPCHLKLLKDQYYQATYFLLSFPFRLLLDRLEKAYKLFTRALGTGDWDWV